MPSLIFCVTFLIFSCYVINYQSHSMKNLILAISVVFPLIALPALSLTEAISAKKINVVVTSNGQGVNDGLLDITITNKTSSTLDIAIPPGQLFICSEDPRQNLILVREELLAIHPWKSVTHQLISMCIESEDFSPGNAIGYTPGKVATGGLLKCSQYINTNKIFNHSGQTAIWVFSNDHDIAWIQTNNENEKQLRKYVAELKNSTDPWYQTTHINTANNQLTDHYKPELPSTEVYNWSSAEINGNFDWKMSSPASITFAIYDESGQVLRTFFSDKSFSPGELSLRFHYKASRIPRGTYYARMTSANGVIAEKSFNF